MIVTLRVGVRAKKGEGGGGGEKIFLFFLPAPSLDSPHFLLSSGVSTWRFRD